MVKGEKKVKKITCLLYAVGMLFTSSSWAMLSFSHNGGTARNFLSQISTRYFCNGKNDVLKKLNRNTLTQYFDATVDSSRKDFKKLTIDTRKNEQNLNGDLVWLTGTMGVGKSQLTLDFLSLLGRTIYLGDKEFSKDKTVVPLNPHIVGPTTKEAHSDASLIFAFLSLLEHASFQDAVNAMDKLEKTKCANGVLVYNYRDVGRKMIESRNGKWTHVDAMFDKTYKFEQFGSTVAGIIVEESQFLTSRQVKDLKKFADEGNFVLFSGITDDFQKNLFPGSAAIAKVWTKKVTLFGVCENCNNALAAVNARFASDGRIIREGPQINIGQEQYHSVCLDCWKKDKLDLDKMGKQKI